MEDQWQGAFPFLLFFGTELMLVFFSAVVRGRAVVVGPPGRAGQLCLDWMFGGWRGRLRKGKKLAWSSARMLCTFFSSFGVLLWVRETDWLSPRLARVVRRLRRQLGDPSRRRSRLPLRYAAWLTMSFILHESGHLAAGKYGITAGAPTLSRTRLWTLSCL